MEGPGESLPYMTQVAGFVATVAGAALSAFSFLFAWLAAHRAKAAREAAIELGRIAQIGDIVADMQELQTTVARRNFAAVADKVNLLRGCIPVTAPAFFG